MTTKRFLDWFGGDILTKQKQTKERNIIYNVLDVCHYIVRYSNDRDYGISNLKLQKILYFVQAYFLISKEESTPCFNEKIEAWDFGPVVPEAYLEYKQHGGADIPTTGFRILFDKENIWNTRKIPFDDNVIKEEDKKLINEVIDKFACYSATDLVSITQRQSPWIDAYVPYKNNEITKDSIREYFVNMDN